MSSELSISLSALTATAATVAIAHTLAGPDHYVPFVAMSKIGRWSLLKTIVVTLACGIAHVASSVLLGGLGLLLGWSLEGMVSIEGSRGDVAGWLLLGFGLAYTIYGLRQAYRNRPHSHWHTHADGTSHTHEHIHQADHAHVHSTALPNASAEASPGPSKSASASRAMTPWVLFVIFAFGPCEPLIPLMMAAAQIDTFAVLMVSGVFAVLTLTFMLAAVLIGYAGLGKLNVRPLERYSHALAGASVLACGLAIHFGL